jgi:aminoglycoside phosphotransferase (APT) family kinase protein
MSMRLPATDAKGMAPAGLAGLDHAAMGLPTEDEYVARYCEHMGFDGLDNWGYYLAFSFFRLAAIAQGVAKRAADGNASNKSAHEAGSMVPPLATMALDIVL